MSQANILIVEDEPIIADDIAMILEKHNYNVCDIVDNAEDAHKRLQESAVDLALIDINIEGGQDGIALAHQINRQFKIPFIFITSYYDSDTLSRAKSTNPKGYIVKPFDEGDLKANVELSLLKSKDIPPSLPEKFFVRDRQELKALNMDDIYYVQGFDNYAKVHTANDQYVVSHTLKSVSEKLIRQGFIRVHKSYLVNFRKISSLSEGFVYLDQFKVPVGRTYRQELIQNISVL